MTDENTQAAEPASTSDTPVFDEAGVVDPTGFLMRERKAGMPPVSNFLDIALLLKACGKTPGNEADLSVQIGVHMEEQAEFLRTLNITSPTGATSNACQEVAAILDAIGRNLKHGSATAVIYDREMALDALCDMDVTGNGVAYLARMNKAEADVRVANSNLDKLNPDGTPVILPGGKVGKREGWTPPDLTGLY